MKGKIWAAWLAFIFLTLLLSSCQGGKSAPVILNTMPPSQQQLTEDGFVLPEIPRIICEGLKQRLDKGESPVLVDTRSSENYKLGHLPGAFNIPYNSDLSSTETSLTSLISGTPRTKLVIFYCDCAEDDTSALMAEKYLTLKTGVAAENIKVLWKGYWRWLELGYPVQQ
jgi:rhodanese-related sulfurtransferase